MNVQVVRALKAMAICGDKRISSLSIAWSLWIGLLELLEVLRARILSGFNFEMVKPILDAAAVLVFAWRTRAQMLDVRTTATTRIARWDLIVEIG